MKGFIVYSTYRIIEGEVHIHLFGKLENGESFLTINKFKPYFFIKESDLTKAQKFGGFDDEKSDFKNFAGDDMAKIIMTLPGNIKPFREKLETNKIKTFEADIRFVVRFLIDKGIKGSLDIEGEHKKGEYVDRIYEEPALKPAEFVPDLKILSIDIETDFKTSKILCMSLYTDKFKKVILISDKQFENTISVKTEKDLLEEFKKFVKVIDPDIITGWNVIEFDFSVLRDRFRAYKIPMILGRTDWDCRLNIQQSFFMTSRAEFPGRMVLDGITLLKDAFIRLDDYKLNTAASTFLGKEKLIQGEGRHEEILELYKKDQQKLIDYNLLDSKLVYDILKKTEVVKLSIKRSLLTGMNLDRVGASIASLDFVYLSEAKKHKLVSTTSGYVEREERIKGGFVMESKPGIYDYILVLDFKSLYPSIIRTFNIDPYAFVPKKDVKNFKKKDLVMAPNGAAFKNNEGLLPEVIERLWAQRDHAKKNKDKLASQAIKILMNSFFGVLANPMCRFYNLDMANAITHFGQHLIKLTTTKVEEQGYDVIYGDTDSIFVKSNAKSETEAAKIGEKLQNSINVFYNKHIKDEYNRKSFLELEFEKTYLKFIMPKIRGSETGAKKRYAGVLNKKGREEIDIVGMEFVRRDWTDLAKKFQIELLDKIFKDEDVKPYVKKLVEDVKKGKYDKMLVYRKALRKDVDEYVKTTPPHVKAARMLDRIEGTLIEYYITIDGPQPIQKLKSKIDYDHYIDKQIKPIADSMLSFQKLSFADILKGHNQRSLGDF